MNLRLLVASLLFPLVLCAQAPVPEKGGEKKKDPALNPITDTPGLPRVLIIGDSISIAYTIPTRQLLEGKANLHRIPENGGSTQTGLEKLDTWLGKQKWDVIHFNWGLHDLKHWKNGKMDMSGDQVSTIDVYENNLRALVKKLQGTGAKLIWATTTPVPVGANGRVAGDEVKYNEAAAKVMKEAKIPTDDLHAAVTPEIAKLQRPKDVHFRDEGSKVLAEKVAAAIAAQLPKK